ncbi:hypothetical protein H845_273 [Komagataeibacter xylinus E25]|nr:hypothetical protein H845_273 [Komagataeibacter xylinus E25]
MTTSTVAATATARPTGAASTPAAMVATTMETAIRPATAVQITAGPAATRPVVTTAIAAPVPTTVPAPAASHIHGHAAVIIAVSTIIAPRGAIIVPAIIAAISGAIHAGDKRTGQYQYRQ